MEAAMINFLNWFWGVCIYTLQVIGGSPGEFSLGYMLANILIFVILQPALIIIFFILWRRSQQRLKAATN
jgi:hypothetical protein|tara:strand:- start:53 stop:262 length:210 start_codon:yes stop_codon:yes gene_type:complete